MKRGFTMIELLIVIAIISILAVLLLITLNPLHQIRKVQDSKRKADLSTIKKVFEDYYNDKLCYPKPQEVCASYPGGSTCTICGLIGPDNFLPYLQKLPCDPLNNATHKYLYEVNDVSCPTNFRIYSLLSDPQDLAVQELGCQGANCGPAGQSTYNYGVSSPNVDIEHGPGITPIQCPPTIIPWHRDSTPRHVCNSDTNRTCKAPNDPCYTDSSCSTQCVR